MRRRPALAIVGVLLTVSAAALAGWSVLAAQNTERVLATARSVPAGQRIAATDLTYVDVPVGALPQAVRGSHASDVLGRYAATDLLAGQLVTPDALADSLTPPRGLSLVALSVEAGRMPTVALQAGDRIDVVSTPSEQDEPPRAGTPDALAAIVVSAEPLPDTTRTVVNVQIEQGRAGLLAARAATGRIAVVLRSRER